MMTEPSIAEVETWPEGARRYLKALTEALERSRAERGHYEAIVHDHEHQWDTEDSLRDRVEALSARNAELKIECEKLRAERRAMPMNA